jgi:hypothetical protein
LFFKNSLQPALKTGLGSIWQRYKKLTTYTRHQRQFFNGFSSIFTMPCGERQTRRKNTQIRRRQHGSACGFLFIFQALKLACEMEFNQQIHRLHQIFAQLDW